MYALLAKPPVEKDLKTCPQQVLPLLNKKIHALADNPRQPQTEKLKGRKGYRLRVGDYRILYEIDDKVKIVTIGRVLHRAKAYRKEV